MEPYWITNSWYVNIGYRISFSYVSKNNIAFTEDYYVGDVESILTTIDDSTYIKLSLISKNKYPISGSLVFCVNDIVTNTIKVEKM